MSRKSALLLINQSLSVLGPMHWRLYFSEKRKRCFSANSQASNILLYLKCSLEGTNSCNDLCIRWIGIWGGVQLSSVGGEEGNQALQGIWLTHLQCTRWKAAALKWFCFSYGKPDKCITDRHEWPSHSIMTNLHLASFSPLPILSSSEHEFYKQ